MNSSNNRSKKYCTTKIVIIKLLVGSVYNQGVVLCPGPTLPQQADADCTPLDITLWQVGHTGQVAQKQEVKWLQ